MKNEIMELFDRIGKGVGGALSLNVIITKLQQAGGMIRSNAAIHDALNALEKERVLKSNETGNTYTRLK